MLALCTLAACSPLARPAPAPADGRAEIQRALEQWPRNFNAGNRRAVCDLFALDARLMYPGRADQSFEQVCAQLTSAMQGTSPQFRYDAPDIREIHMAGELAMVRLVWTLHVSAPGKEETIRENGLDVFRRQTDGTWKIYISHAYPDVEASPDGSTRPP